MLHMQKLDILHRIQVTEICLYWGKRVQWAGLLWSYPLYPT